MACRQNMLISSIFKAFIGTFGYYNLCQRKLKVISRKKYALHILILPLEFSLEIHKDEHNLHESPPKKKPRVRIKKLRVFFVHVITFSFRW